MLGSATPSVDQLLVLQAVRCRCPSTAPLSVFVSLNSPALPRELTERFLPAIVASERFLIDNEFMGGASFSIADIAAFTIISAVSRHLAWDHLPRLAAWHDRIGRRPGVQTGMTAFDDRRKTVN